MDLGFVPKDDIFYAIKAVVATQRDYGRRDDRKQARLKYLVHRWGIDKFRAICEQYYGKKVRLEPPCLCELPPSASHLPLLTIRIPGFSSPCLSV